MAKKVAGNFKRLHKEFLDWAPEAGQVPQGFMAALKDDRARDLSEWYVVIPGPEGSPYEKGSFVLSYSFPQEYPFKPPQVLLKTPIFHSLIYPDGFITPSSVGLLGDEWSPTQTACKVAKAIRSFLGKPQIYGVQDRQDISSLYLSNREEHHRIARYWAEEHGQLVPKSIRSAWAKAFGPPFVLTLDVSSGCDGCLLLTGTSIAGTQVAEINIDEQTDEAKVRELLAQQLDIPESFLGRRLKLCSPDGLLLFPGSLLDQEGCSILKFISKSRCCEFKAHVAELENVAALAESDAVPQSSAAAI